MHRIGTIKDLTRYLIFSFFFLTLYTVAEFVTSTKTGVSHDVLTTCVYGFFAGEVATCGLIKIFKLRGSNHE